LAFKCVEEVCQNYAVDGVELDFFRHPVYFKKYALEGKAGEEELKMMTDLVKRIRAMADREGAKRGKPILLTIRVPDSVEFCRAMGLDVERWLQEELVDILETLGQEKNWVVYTVQPGNVVQGMNTLSCTLGTASDNAITIDDMLLQVRY
jgi:hypothetical protein